ncbi:MAG: efflux RND transporter periplasmic adaptor subunit [Rubrimonas sp.]
MRTTVLASAFLLVATAAMAQAPAPAVIVRAVQTAEIIDEARLTGRVEAIEAVDIRARVQGFLQSTDFAPGALVGAGDPLFVIEPDLYETRVAAARAELSGAEAALRQARRTLERNQELADRGTVSPAALDEAIASAESAEARVEAALVSLRQAELELSYTRIASPIAGRIGQSLFSVGALVGPDSGALARVVRLNPVRVAFSITEREITELRAQALAGGRQPDADALSLTLLLPNGEIYDREGRFEFVGAEVDQGTGTVQVRAVFDNPDQLLIPNQFVTVIARQGAAETLPVAPQTAILQDREGRFVYVLTDDDTVSVRRIRTGARAEGGWAVTEGLQAGELIVVSGVQRLRDGAAVQPSRRDLQ